MCENFAWFINNYEKLASNYIHFFYRIFLAHLKIKILQFYSSWLQGEYPILLYIVNKRVELFEKNYEKALETSVERYPEKKAG